MGVQAEESVSTTAPRAGVPPDDPGFVEFATAGSACTGEFRCADCGYGAVIQRLLPPCPMCGGSVWESRERRPPRFSG